MGVIVLTLQDVNGDPKISGGNINITTNQTNDVEFNEVGGNVVSTVALGDTMTIAGFNYDYEYLGFCYVREGSLGTTHPAVFVRITGANDGGALTAGTTYAIDLTGKPGDVDYPDLPNGNTKCKTATNDYATEQTFPICFVKGAQLETADGLMNVEDICAGDRVLTVDNGLQEVLWVGHQRFDLTGPLGFEQNRPVRIKAGAFGPNQPSRDLLVSQQHRILKSGPCVELVFGEPEILAPAKTFLNDVNVTLAKDLTYVDYYHFVLRGHELMIAEGVPAESLFPAEIVLENYSPEKIEELFQALPELRHNLKGYGPTARLSPKVSEVKAGNRLFGTL